jgi:hypothetical protein
MNGLRPGRKQTTRRSRMRDAQPRLRVGLLVALLFCGLPAAAHAAGIERTIQGDDLRLVLDSRWAGCASGGYWPVRFVLTNTGPSRTITVALSVARGSSEGSVVVRRTLAAESNSTQRFTLSVPLTSNQSYGMFALTANGRELERFRTSLSAPDFQSSHQQRPALVVISRDLVDCAAWEASMPTTTGPHSHMGGGGRSEDHQIVSPEMLPEKWIDYTGVDVVAIPLGVLDKLPATSKTPLVEWVAAGGHLMVYEAGTDNALVEAALDWKTRASATRLGPFGFDPGVDPGANTKAEGVVPLLPIAPPVPPVAVPAGISVSVAPTAPGAVREVPWFRNRMNLRSGDFGLGRVVVFAENPFPGSIRDWEWAGRVWPAERRTFPSRLGTAPRDGEHNQFFEYLIPGVGSAPVTMFLVLMTLFALAIGPLNLWLLSRKRRLYLMLVTVPVLSLATCLSLFVYAVVADGFGIKSRVRSVTYLDQGTASAVRMARIALYAGLSPSGGLKFDAATAVLPVWPNFTVNSPLELDWTDTQHLSGGWLPSRTTTQFLTIAHLAERGRINVGTPSGDTLRIENGLATELSQLLVVDDTGRQWFGRDIPAGAAGELAPQNDSDLAALRKAISVDQPALPAGLNSPNDMALFGGASSSRRYMWGGGSAANFSNSLLEQLLKLPAPAIPGEVIPPLTPDFRLRKRSYHGVFRGNPGVENGVTGASEIQGFHVIVGRY